MEIKYWTNFSKRKNSTLTPSSGTALQVRLKDNCSIINPVIESAALPVNANYIYIADFARYYYVTNVVYKTNTIKEFSCEVDVLSSFKTAIGSTNARIAFSSTGWDKNIADTRMTTETTKLKYERHGSTVFEDEGCYILTVFNPDQSNSLGLGLTYAIPVSDIGKIKAWLCDTSIMQALSQFFNGRPLESIFSCIWVPFPYASAPGFAAFTSIKVGNQDSSGSGYTINNKPIQSGSFLDPTDITVDIPYRYNDFRDSDPYSSMQIYLPGIGYTDINLADWLDTATMTIDYRLDYSNGDVTYYLKDINGYIVQTASANLAVQCPLGQIMTSGSGIVSGIGGVVGSGASLAVGLATKNVGMAIGSAGALLASGASIAMNANKRATSIKGAVGGKSSILIKDVILTGFYIDTEDVDDVAYIATKGRPVGVTHAISNHSGYVECDDASVGNIGSPMEKDRINTYLNTGFYYE